MKEYHPLIVQIFEPETAINPHGKCVNVFFPVKISKRCQLHSYTIFTSRFVDESGETLCAVSQHLVP
jgi:hypothetical protein